MEKHILTAQQARRLGVPHLAWTEVEVILKSKSEKHPNDVNTPIAKEVYSNGEYLGGTLSLVE